MSAKQRGSGAMRKKRGWIVKEVKQKKRRKQEKEKQRSEETQTDELSPVGLPSIFPHLFTPV